MPNVAVQQEITLTLDGSEGWALRNALGAMSVTLWQQAGLTESGIAHMNEIFRALDEALHSHGLITRT